MNCKYLIKLLSLRAFIVYFLSNSLAFGIDQTRAANPTVNPCRKLVDEAFASMGDINAANVAEKIHRLATEVIPFCKQAEAAIQIEIEHAKAVLDKARLAATAENELEICRYKSRKLEEYIRTQNELESETVSPVRDVRLRQIFLTTLTPQDLNSKGEKALEEPKKTCNAIGYFEQKCFRDDNAAANAKKTLRASSYCIVDRQTESNDDGKDVCGYELDSSDNAARFQIKYECLAHTTDGGDQIRTVLVPGNSKFVPIICDYPEPAQTVDNKRLTKEFFEAPPCALKFEGS